MISQLTFLRLKTRHKAPKITKDGNFTFNSKKEKNNVQGYGRQRWLVQHEVQAL